MHTYPTNQIQTKQHFLILDGLRGVAAISVVVYHFMEFVVPDYHKNFIAHGHLAVDFFFCLSGFVIAYAYDHRIEQIGISNFLKLRFIRLHPLVIIGAIIGLITFIFDPFSNLYSQYAGSKTLLMFVTSCLLIPFQMVPERYFNFFHLNPPTWSLFWEYIANIFYVLVLFKLKNKLIWILVAVAAILLCYETYLSGYLGVGWGGDNFWGGGIRIFYSFLAGMLIYRSKWIIASKLGFISMSCLLLLAFLIPFADQSNYFADPITVLLYFPLLISLGAGASLSKGLTKICKFLGDISYPLYMIHYPFMWLFLSYIEANKPTMRQMVVAIPVGTILLIGLSYLVMVFLDVPIWNYLKGKMLGKKLTHQQ